MTVNILRSLLVTGALLTGACNGNGNSPAAPPPLADPSVDEVLADLEQRSFRFFWELANPDNGLVPDRSPSPSFSSIAAVGFGLTAYPVGVERGYITRDQAIERVLNTLRFFRGAQQGPEPTGVTGYQGFFYHFLDMNTGLRFQRIELSTVDTTLLLGGILFCQSYFERDTPAESEIRRLADEIYQRVNWQWAQARPPAISMGWHPETGFIDADWRGYNEAMLVYVLALASPTFPVEPDAWLEWTGTYDDSWGDVYGQEHLSFGPLFGHHYSHAWIDFRGIRDAYMRARNLDYAENSRRATYAQRAYAIANPMRWRGYDVNVWGLTACDGPANVQQTYMGEQRQFRSYSARGVGLRDAFDDGTLCPSAAAGSLPFAPEIALPALQEMRRRHGYTYSTYGFLGAFNPSFDYDVPLADGRLVPGAGWVADDWLGIDQGIILLMLENYRSGFVWGVMRNNPYIRRGLERAGFSGGWLAEGNETKR